MEDSDRRATSDMILKAWLNVELPEIKTGDDGKPINHISYLTGLKKIAEENGGWIPLNPVRLEFGSLEIQDPRFDEFRPERKDTCHNKPDEPAARAA